MSALYETRSHANYPVFCDFSSKSKAGDTHVFDLSHRPALNILATVMVTANLQWLTVLCSSDLVAEKGEDLYRNAVYTQYYQYLHFARLGRPRGLQG